MIGLFVMGVLLWVIGSLMERHELAERRKRLPPWVQKQDGDRR
jgi:hypothetical protein